MPLIANSNGDSIIYINYYLKFCQIYVELDQVSLKALLITF